MKNLKVLIRPSKAESTKVKNVIIGEERPERKIPQSKTPGAATKISTLRGQSKEKIAGNKLIGQTG